MNRVQEIRLPSEGTDTIIQRGICLEYVEGRREVIVNGGERYDAAFTTDGKTGGFHAPNESSPQYRKIGYIPVDGAKSGKEIVSNMTYEELNLDELNVWKQYRHIGERMAEPSVAISHVQIF